MPPQVAHRDPAVRAHRLCRLVSAIDLAVAEAKHVHACEVVGRLREARTQAARLAHDAGRVVRETAR
jgi:hypothetical protein